MYKCLCTAVTQEQIDELIKLGIEIDKIYDILNVGKDCGTCIRGEINDRKRSCEDVNKKT